MLIEVSTISEHDEEVTAIFDVSLNQNNLDATFVEGHIEATIKGMPNTPLNEYALRAMKLYDELEEQAITEYDPDEEEAMELADKADRAIKFKKEDA